MSIEGCVLFANDSFVHSIFIFGNRVTHRIAYLYPIRVYIRVCVPI